MEQLVREEVLLLSKLQHPQIVRMYGAIQVSDQALHNTGVSDLYTIQVSDLYTIQVSDLYIVQVSDLYIIQFSDLYTIQVSDLYIVHVRDHDEIHVSDKRRRDKQTIDKATMLQWPKTRKQCIPRSQNGVSTLDTLFSGNVKFFRLEKDMCQIVATVVRLSPQLSRSPSSALYLPI